MLISNMKIYNTLVQVSISYPTAAEYTFLSSTHRSFSRIESMLGHKTSLSKFKETEIIPRIFSDHNGMKLDTNNRRKMGKSTNT